MNARSALGVTSIPPLIHTLSNGIDAMKNEIVVPIHRAIDKEAVLGRLKGLGVKGLSYDDAEKQGVITRVSNLLCAMHALTTVSQLVYEQAAVLFDACGMNKHELKRACAEYQKACDRWFKFWESYQTADGAREMDNESADLYEQFFRWAQLPIRWSLGDRQEAPRDTEPLIEIDREDRIWRVYRDVAECDVVLDDREEWAVMRSDQPDGSSTMTCVERGLDRGLAFMSAKRMSANDPGRLYTASKLESLTEKRMEVVPYKAYYGGEIVGDIKNVIKG